jgi:hypothetical protein
MAGWGRLYACPCRQLRRRSFTLNTHHSSTPAPSADHQVQCEGAGTHNSTKVRRAARGRMHSEERKRGTVLRRRVQASRSARRAPGAILVSASSRCPRCACTDGCSSGRVRVPLRGKLTYLCPHTVTATPLIIDQRKYHPRVLRRQWVSVWVTCIREQACVAKCVVTLAKFALLACTEWRAGARKRCVVGGGNTVRKFIPPLIEIVPCFHLHLFGCISPLTKHFIHVHCLTPFETVPHKADS